MKFVRANKAKPWFAMLSFYSVHTPLMGREDLVAHYEKKREKLGLELSIGQSSFPAQLTLEVLLEHAESEMRVGDQLTVFSEGRSARPVSS